MVVSKKVLKSIKKDKKIKQEKVETKIEKKENEESKEVKQEQLDNKQNKRNTIESEISTDDFRSYLNKRKETTKPKRIDLPEDFKDKTMPFMPRPGRRGGKPKTIAEEIKTASPELKALIISGVLGPKDFDNF